MSNHVHAKEIRPYQQKVVDFLASHPKAMAADQQGLGKTVETLCALNMLELGPEHRVLFAVSKGKIYDWLEEFAIWCPTLEPPVIVHGQYKRLEKWAENNWVITTRETVRQDIKSIRMDWDLVIVDEAHRIFRNHKTVGFKAFKKLDAQRMWMLTGTPARKGPIDFFGYLHMFAPKVFTSYWRFAHTFCYVEKTHFGTQVYGIKDAQSLESLRAILRRYMIRHTKEELGDEMPPKTVGFLNVEMTKEQRQIHDELLDEMLVILDSGDLIIAPTVLTKILRMRQLMVCPKVLSSNLGYGAGIEAIADNIELQPDNHAAIFMSFKGAIGYLSAYLAERFPDMHIYAIHGGMKPLDVFNIVKEYKKNRGIILATIKFIEGQNFETCSYGYVLGPEYTPDENEQAEDRLHRKTSKEGVNIYYVKHRNSVEDLVYAIVNGKFNNVNEVLRDKSRLKRIFRRPTKTS